MKEYTFSNPVALSEGDGYYWEGQNAQVVYDGTGLEDESDPQRIGFSCEVCGHHHSVDLQDAIMNGWDSFRLFRDGSSASSMAELESKFGLQVVTNDYGTFHRTTLGFSPFTRFVSCAACGQMYMMVLGYGESQPGRYLAVLQGIRKVEGEGLPEGMKAL